MRDENFAPWGGLGLLKEMDGTDAELLKLSTVLITSRAFEVNANILTDLAERRLQWCETGSLIDCSQSRPALTTHFHTDPQCAVDQRVILSKNQPRFSQRVPSLFNKKAGR